ncbi:serine/threonine kinase [Aphelenchoides avenae]|nr:serine/threonine kinase [Aphelenchus avenae]
MTPASARLIKQLDAARGDPARQQELVYTQNYSTLARAMLEVFAAPAGHEGTLAKQGRTDLSQQPTDEPPQNALSEYWQTVSPKDKYTFPQVGKVLGRGTNGKVMTVTLKRDVAVKVVDVRNKPQDVIRYFLGEAEVMFLNESEFLMKCTECYWWLDKLYFIMPLMRFGSLATLLAQIKKHSARMRKSVPESVWRYIAYAIFKGLEDLHRENRVHRDLKLDNVLIDSDGKVKLTDFGWSKKISPEDAAYVSTAKLLPLKSAFRCTVAGTYYTMAPEVAANYFLDKADQPLKEYGLSVDIRSAGVVLVEMATGKQEEFDSFDPDEFCERIRSGGYATELRERVMSLNISEGFKQLILFCLEDDPTKRKTSTWLLENTAFLRDANDRKPLQKLIKKLEEYEKRDTPQKRQRRK